MPIIKTFIYFFILLLSINTVFSQVLTKQIQQDSLSKKQEQRLKSLEQAAERQGGLTQKAYGLVFRPIKKKQPTLSVVKDQFVYKPFHGKIIRNINIKSLDPFGFSVNDTTRTEEVWAERFGNNLHVKTKERTIKNQLYFREHDLFDSLIAKESERLIRSQRYVHQVVIRPILVGKDSVDIDIRVLDAWSLLLNGNITSSRVEGELTEYNFLGMGHNFQNNFQKDYSEPRIAYGVRYSIPNIGRFHTNMAFAYDLDIDGNYLKSAQAQRKFLSPLTRWAGGVYFDEKFERDSLPDSQGDYALLNFKQRNQNFWIGHSFRLSEGGSEEERTQNLILTLGCYNTQFTERPGAIYDSVNFYRSNRMYLFSFGIASRQYVQDRYVFEYDKIEDVAIGRTFAITLGFRETRDRTQPYIGGRYSFGNYHDYGFLGADIEAGSFFDSGQYKQSVIRIKQTYFSKLYQYGSWYFRQFVKPELVLGFNRKDIIKDRVNLDGINGMVGFTNKVRGTRKALLTLQTQSYAPGIWYGFRFSPFFSFTAGMLGDTDNKFLDGKLYTRLGLGVLISNDFLVFSQFQLSFAYFPTVPFEGSGIIRTNSFKNTEFTLQDFSIAQPEIIPYE